ncbi:hypothetical protein D0T60_18200 [Bacteroides sp. 224]|nr:hypothetical protein [Bacteroides sp. 224]
MYEKAFCYLRDFRERSRNKDDRAYVLLAKGNIWKDALEYDSAYHYYSLASQSTHPFIATNAYQQLSKLSALSGRYKQAFSSLQNYDELLTSAAMSLHREEMTDKYKEEKYKNELNEIRLAKKTRELFIVLLLAFVFFILAGAYVFYLRSKNLKLQHSKEVSLLREKESSLREALFRKMSVSQKIPSLDAGDESETIDKRIALSSADWAEIVQIVNDSYDHFAERLKAHYPLLTEKDIRFCCLIKINVTLKDLSDIYCISKSAITKKKFRLKKEKIGFKDSDQSLDDFLRTF